MSFFSSLFSREKEEPFPEWDEEIVTPVKPLPLPSLPQLKRGMPLEVYQGGELLLVGQLTAIADDSASIGRRVGDFSLPICETNIEVLVKGFDGTLPLYMKGRLVESTRMTCRVVNLVNIPYENHRDSYRLRLGIAAQLFFPEDKKCENPESCKLLDISTGGACFESEFIHGDGEPLRLRVHIADYVPLSFLGQVIRVEEPTPGLFRYGFLFAQLSEKETDNLYRIIANIQMGNGNLHARHGYGHW